MTTTEYVPIFIRDVKSFGLFDSDEFVINGYHVLPDIPDRLDSAVVEFFHDGDISSIRNKFDSVLSDVHGFCFWTVWEVEHVHPSSSWSGAEEYDYSVRLLGIADETKWTPQSLGLIEA